MPKALTPRPGGKGRPTAPAPADLPRDVVEEIQRVTRPTEVRDALSRLSRAVELLERGDTGAAVAEAAKAKQLVSPFVLGARGARARALRPGTLAGGPHGDEGLPADERSAADQNHIIADCLRALGRPAEAVPLAEEELRAKVPNEAKAEAVIVAASALADQGRYAEALAFLGRAQDHARTWPRTTRCASGT